MASLLPQPLLLLQSPPPPVVVVPVPVAAINVPTAPPLAVVLRKGWISSVIERFLTPIEKQLGLPSPQFDYDNFYQYVEGGHMDRWLHVSDDAMFVFTLSTLFRKIGYFVLSCWQRIVKVCNNVPWGLLELMNDREMSVCFTQFVIIIYTQHSSDANHKWSSARRNKQEMTARDQALRQLCARMTTIQRGGAVHIPSPLPTRRIAVMSPSMKYPSVVKVSVLIRQVLLWMAEACIVYDTSTMDGKESLVALRKQTHNRIDTPVDMPAVIRQAYDVMLMDLAQLKKQKVTLVYELSLYYIPIDFTRLISLAWLGFLYVIKQYNQQGHINLTDTQLQAQDNQRQVLMTYFL
jgi:hypothetical protein